MKKLTALFLAAVLLFSCVPVTVSAGSVSECTIRVKDATAIIGQTVNVEVKVENNPGIQGATLRLSWDDGLVLESAENGEAFQLLTMTPPGRLVSGGSYVWYRQTALKQSEIVDGTILKLQFRIASGVAEGSKLGVRASYTSGDIFDVSLNPVNVTTENGRVTVVSYTPGDVDGNDRLNAMDLVLLSRYIADGCTTDPEGYNVSLNPNAGDVNDDGRLNALDLVLTSRYIADGCTTDPEGYNVTLKPSGHDFGHTHTMENFAANEATCTANGNKPYWRCEGCGKYYLDEAGLVETTVEATVIPKKGHTVVIDKAIAPTATSTGLTEGSHCSVCHEVFVSQEIIPVPQAEQYAISYSIANGDPYLASQIIENPNPGYYTSAEGLTLKNISCEGYRFLGWFDLPSGSNAEIVKKISVGSKGTVELYAHWEKIVYNINLSDSINGDTKLSYTVDEGATLDKDPEWSGYVFAGWSDKSGKIVKSVPAGTTGNINLTANWTSERNKTIPVSNLGTPDILHDEINGQMLFAYEIGEIRNVPLYTIKEFLNVVAGGVTLTESITDSKSITESTARNIAETVSKATTDTSAWTLSDSWNKTTDESWDHAEEVGEDTMHAVEKYREECSSEGQTPAYVLGSGDNTTYTTVNSGGSAVSAKTENNVSTNNVAVPLTTETDKKWKTSEKLDTWANAVDEASNVATVVGAGITLASGGAAAPVAAVVAGGLKVIAGGLKLVQSIVRNNESKKSNENKENQEPQEETAVYTAAPQTTTYFINTNTGYSQSTKTGQKDTTSQLLHSLISNTHHYGEAYSVGGEKSDSESHAESNTNTREYGSTVTYSDAVTKTVTRTYSNEGAKSGYYRIVCAGTAHVFAVVGYDIATSTFYTYTYTVMDDETKEFLDYSKDGTFCDYENGILPFEVPEFVLNYVDTMTRQSDGIIIDDATGTVVAYEPSDEAKNDTLVYIPTYASVTDAKGTKKAVKITGIADKLFMNNEQVECVILGCFNERIPESAFENCTNLKYVAAANQLSIGMNAFSGCTNLENFAVSDTVAEIGSNAFSGANKISVEAKTWDVVSDALGCGANNVTLTLPRKSYLSEDNTTKINPNVFDMGHTSNDQQTSEQMVKIPSSFKSFDIIGAKDCEYHNVQIESDAEKTSIYNLIIKNDERIPVICRSANVLFNEIQLKNTAVCLNLDAEHTELSMFGTNKLLPGNQRAAVVRSVNMNWFNPNSVGKLLMEGNLYVFGNLTGTRAMPDYLTFASGEVIPITGESEYNSLLHSIKIAFHANGGACGTESIEATPGIAIGTLPTANRDYYTFDGWYTAASGGTKITTDSKFSQDTTVYAHWTQNAISGWETSAPSGAQIVNTKWEYDKRSETTSSSSSLAGWTKYDTTSYWGDYGGWSSWTDTAYYGSDSRQVETRSVVSGYNMVSYTMGDPYRAYYSYDSRETNKNHVFRAQRTGYWTAEQFDAATQLSPGTYFNAAYGARDDCYGNVRGNGTAYYNAACEIVPMYVVSIDYKTQYRYRDRTLYYTYYYYKLERLTSYDSNPAGGAGVSNVVKYVQYRAR